MDAEREAKRLLGNLCSDPAAWCFDYKTGCTCRGELAAALLRAHAAGRREAVEECARVADAEAAKALSVGLRCLAERIAKKCRALAAGAGEKEGEG